MEGDLLLSVGQQDDRVVLTKKSIKPGFHSNIKPGNKRGFVLKKPLAIGHPVIEKIISDRHRTEGVALGFQKTTTILAINQNDNGFSLETETSFYDVIFEKNNI
jgi:hypothetical protein